MLISFKLHSGKIPHFVDKYLGGIAVNNRHYGTVKNNPSEYVPQTIEILTEEQFIAAIVQANISLSEDQFMSEEEKVLFAQTWIAENNS